MKFGMISCNFFSRIYNYNVPADMNWGDMVKKHHEKFSETDLAVLLEEIKSLGVDYLELWAPHASYTKLGREDAARIRKLIESKGLTPLVYCIGGWRPADMDIIERGFEFAAGLGVDLINGTIPLEGNEKLLDKIDEYAQKYKIRYSIENHAKPALEDPRDVKRVLDAHSAYIGANLDVGIYYRTGYDPLEAAKILEGRVYHVHFKDVKKGAVKGSCPSGEGDAPLAELAQYLREKGYKDMISLEYEPRFDPTEDLKRSVAYCKSIL